MRTAVRSIALACLVALAAVACDGADRSGPRDALGAGGGIAPEAILRQASTDLAERTVTARFAMTTSGGGERFEMTGDLVLDPAHEQARMSLEAEGIPGMGDITTDLILDGTAVYVRGAVLPDAGWIKVDADHDGMQAALGGAHGMDPSAFLDLLRGAAGVEVVGTEDVRGHATTHFSGTIDPVRLISSAPPSDERDAALETIGRLGDGFGDVDITFDAWVDDAGVPWRLALAFASTGVDAGMQVTFDVLQLGGDVRIEVPSGYDVTDLGSLALPSAA